MVLAERLVLSLSSVIGRLTFRSLYCSRLEVRLSVRTPLVGFAYVVGKSLVKRQRRVDIC